MPFDSGRVTFTRFLVQGDAPPAVDDTFLSILSEARFRESDIGTPDEVESGFTTGQHLFDTQFTYEKNGFAPGNARANAPGSSAASACALFALRLDTHKVPSDIKRAYRLINEQAAASASPTGYPSKSEKRDARETANEQIRAELATGKYRKTKIVPVLWDLAGGRLYCGAAGTTVIEHLSRQMRQAFAVELSNLSAGVLAGTVLKTAGRSRDYEDIHPSAFTAPPADRHAIDDDDLPAATSGGDLPNLPWIARAVDLKDYLGNEFLLWLWWQGEKPGQDGGLPTEAGDIFVALDKALDMDCAWERTGKQTLRGDHPTRLPEAGDALQTGKWPRKAGLIVADQETQWELTLQADGFVVSGATLPEPADGEAATPREALERRLELITRLGSTLDALYASFLTRRTGSHWSSDRQAIRQWIKSRHATKAIANPSEPALAGQR